MDLLKTTFFVFFLIIGNNISLAQNDHSWWYEIHQHDGVTSWEDYLIISPGYFGPNALPVPIINQGLIKNELELEVAFEGHYNTHEQTNNLFTQLFIPLQKDKVGLQLSIVPVEFFSYDTLIRDQRFSRNYEGKGSAIGDLYIGTQIQLLRNHPKWPDILFGINLRTASGNRYSSARFIDSPGYFFDLGLGKSYTLKKSPFHSIRTYAMLGFYVWQTNLNAYFQNDAFLYGAGFQLYSGLFTISNELGGYYGYLDNGDRPLVYRFRMQLTQMKSLNFSLQFEHGIKDYNFRSLRFSALYSFKSNK
ncbi:MAG: hypothetical protein PF484_12035 [Bacteroidales bacterium]|nr:hypothetical protein [Bacteroidales bacterium]